MTGHRWLLLLGAVAAVVPVAALSSGCSRGAADEATSWQAPAPLEVEAVPVSRGGIVESLKLNGSLVPLRFANIVAEVDGVIKNIPDAEEELHYEAGGKEVSRGVTLDIGHRVKYGQVLVEIDPTDCKIALKAAEAKLALAENTLAKLKIWRRPEELDEIKTRLAEASAVLERTTSELNRAEALSGKNTISREDYDRTRALYLVAKAAQERAQAAWELARNGPLPEEVAIAQANVDLAQADVTLCEEKIRKCTIRAPYDAVIAERYVGVGDRVTALPRVEIMQIIDPSVLFAQVAVPEKYQGRIHVGDRTRVRARETGEARAAGGQSAGGDDSVPGVVALVNDKIDPDTRTFRVRVGIDNQQGRFMSGSFVEVELAIDSAADAVTVPAGAVTFDKGQPAALVVDGDRVSQRPLRLGIFGRSPGTSADDRYEVLAGLSAGERVVVGSATAILVDGMTVRLKAAESVAAEVQP